MKIIGAIMLSGLMSCACSSQNENQNNKTMMNTTIREKVKSAGTVSLPAVQVWEKLIAFGGTQKFVPDLIEKVEVEGAGTGAIRTIHLKGGGEITEELTLIDEPNYRMAFVILSTPMPVHNYEGIFTVRKKSEQECEVTFESVYEAGPDDRENMRKVIKGFQETFISNLDK